MNISHLVEKIKKGDNKSFEKLYKLTEREVWFTCISFLKNETTAQDIMQETYITAFLKIQSLEKSSQIRSWLNRIAVNKCKNYLKGKGEIQLDDEIFENQAIVDERISIPEEYISDKAKREIILSIMQEVLSDVQYQTVIMHYFFVCMIGNVSVEAKTVTKDITIGKGKTYAIEQTFSGKATFKTSNKKIAVIKNGKIIGKSIGKAKITIKDKGNTYIYKITVAKAYLNQNEIIVNVGKTVNLKNKRHERESKMEFLE